MKDKKNKISNVSHYIIVFNINMDISIIKLITMLQDLE